MSRRLAVRTEAWSLRETFTISRGSKSRAEVVVAEVTENGCVGRGECVPYSRYRETVDGVRKTLQGCAPAMAAGIGRAELSTLLPAGAARNALDCALWDLEAKQTGMRAWELAGLPAPTTTLTAFTLSMADPVAMGEAAARAQARPLLKLKLGARDVVESVQAVRRGAPRARLIVDANEAWPAARLPGWLAELHQLGVELVEQPLPAADDAALEGLGSPIPIGADESCHTVEDLERLATRYQVVNIKLDKTGGLTEALRLHAAASARGLEIMVGCMVGTSLSMAPAMLLTAGARFVDLDGPLLMARDRSPGLRYDGSTVAPPEPDLWG